MTPKAPTYEWYKGRVIFITGGSGFMGKVLVEKLLYSYDVKAIYLLLRTKRGRTPEQRIEDMWKLPMFQRLRKSKPDAITKIIPLHGDVSTDGLGLNETDMKMLIDNTDVVFHCAATLKLEAKLKDAIEQNTSGTQRVIDVCKQIKNLKAFIHFSTAFCSADIDVFEERVYPSQDNPRDVIEVTRWMREDALNIATPSLIAPHPNTYTYSKRLAETLVASEADNMRVAIVRPSIVTPAWNEPLPGWVDTLNGPMGLLVGAGKGVIRSMHCKAENRAQVVPVDAAICVSIYIAYKLASAPTKPKDVPVYNLTQDAKIHITWGEVLDRGRSIVYDNPFEMQIWYPDGDIRSSKLIHQIYCIFLHWLPAYFIDFLMFIFRQKRFMLRIQRKIHDGLELLQFFTTREWIFKSDNFMRLVDEMHPLDKAILPLDFDAISIEEYLKLCVLGTRQYCMKEDLSSLPRCRLQQKFLYVLDRAFLIAFYLGLIWLLCSCSDTAKGVFDFAGTYVRQVPLIGALVPISS